MNKNLSRSLFVLSIASLLGLGIVFLENLHHFNTKEIMIICLLVFVYISLTFILWKNNFFKRNN